MFPGEAIARGTSWRKGKMDLLGFWANESGSDLLDYAIFIAVVGAVVAGTLTFMGIDVRGAYLQIKAQYV